MLDRFFYFLKLFAQLICWVCVAIAAIGAMTTKDTIFLVCGIVAILTVGYKAVRVINESTNN